jgi:tetratricopeptide (TPR) repeat protein
MLLYAKKFYSLALNSPSDTSAILFQSGQFQQAKMYYRQLLPYLRHAQYVREEIQTCDTLKQIVFRYETKLALLLSNYKIPPVWQNYQQPCISIYHILRALCRLGLGSTYERNGQLKHAFESYRKALFMFEQAHDEYFNDSGDDVHLIHVYKAHCLVGFGNLSLIEQRFKRAETYYLEALLLFDKYLPVGHPDITRTRQKLANIIEIYRCKPAMALEDYTDYLDN